MRRPINTLLLVLVLAVAGGLVVAAVARVREAAASTACLNNLRLVALALHNYAGDYQHFPQATLPNDWLAPEQRLSWLVNTTAYLDQVQVIIDRKVGWDAAENLVPKARYLDNQDRWTEEPLGEVKVFRCPTNPASASTSTPGLTHYVGVTGIGPDAATRGLGYPGTGVFGYDRKVGFADIRDALANTLLVIETTRENGPWTAGGFPTARGLDPAGGAYLGAAGQFGSFHRGTNAAFADGSVRCLAADIRPEALEAMATVGAGD